MIENKNTGFEVGPIELTSSFSVISPSAITQEGFDGADQEIIPNRTDQASFIPFQDIVEFWIYDNENTLLAGENNFINYEIVPSPSVGGVNEDGNASELKLNPIQDTLNFQFDQGEINVIYNFLHYELGTTVSGNENIALNKYYISEISQDRTEVRLKTNYFSNDDIQRYYTDFKTIINTSPFADEFYLNFGDNQLEIAVNCLLDDTTEEYSILIKLYSALPPQFLVKDLLSIVTKPAESLGYNVSHPILQPGGIENVTYLRGPNYNLKVNEFTNNSTNLKSKDELLLTPSTASSDELSNKLNQNGVVLSPDYSYSTFNEFINFSSAKKRIENFIEKVNQIQSYEADITTINGISAPSITTPQVSSSLASAQTGIQNIIKNFDGYEYFLYYGTGSSSYPKTGSSYPYELLPTTNTSTSVWLGSDDVNNPYYGGIILSASFYDNNNQNWLYYTIPEFIKDNSDNSQYVEFSNMVGQSFDEVWLYTQAVTKKLNTSNNLNDGVPLGLADDVIASLGYDGFGNNFNNQNNFIGLTGENNGVYVPPTGSELITNYIAVNGGQILNYWDVGYSYEDYVASLEDPGYPYAIDKVSKEIFKRLYHNMSYLVKKKGTIAGLRQLINIWGIPNTILRINEFGGKDKDNSDDYDLWYNRYSYAFHPNSTQNVASASVVFPWMPLERNRIAESQYVVPDNFQFRFKTTGYPSSSFAGEFFTQSLAVKKSDGDDTSTDFDFGISLFYEPVATGSYSGSASSEYENWGKMRFYISGAAADGGVATSNDIYLPFYDKGWWSVMLQRNQHVPYTTNTSATTYTLYAKNKINNGFDGAQIGFEGSASIVSDVSESVNEAWNKFGVTATDGIYLGGFVSGSIIGGETTGLSGKIFSGSLQEFRYYSNDIPEATFNDFVMNPESIEGNAITGSQSSFDIVNFRAPLGNELENVFTSSQSSSYTDVLTSMHPAITGSANIVITGSFVNPTGNVTSSEYRVLYYENSTTRTFSKTNTEVYFLDQPSIGFRNRISDKIQIRDGDDFGTILSNRISIQQDYQISRSYTENINSLEVAFSPQDEVNDDIIASFGYGVIADTIADPRFVSSSEDYYPELRKTAEDYFQKYTKGNVYDYLRLIKYFDNSIFKAIKSYAPARTSVSTGIVIKQHMLERNRFQPVQITEGTQVATTPSGALNTPIILENIVISCSIDTINQEAPSGSTGGSANKFNYVDSSFLVESGVDQGDPHGTPFGKIVNTQSYEIINETVLGNVVETINQQEEFYDGEFSGSEFIATTQSLFYNPFTKPNTTEAIYNTDVVLTSDTQSIQSIDTAGVNDYVRLALGHMYMPTASICIITGSEGQQLFPTSSGNEILVETIEQFQSYSTDYFDNTLGSKFSSGGADDNPIIVGLWNGDGFGNLPVGEDYYWYVAYIIIPDYHHDDLTPGNNQYSYNLPTQFTNASVVYGNGNAGESSAFNPTPTKNTWSYDYYNNKLTPYFKIDIGECFNSSSNNESYLDPGFGDLSTYTIDSSAFAPRRSIAHRKMPLSQNGNEDLQGQGFYQFFGDNGTYQEGRPLIQKFDTANGTYTALTASFIFETGGGGSSLNAYDSLGNPITETTSSLNNSYVLNNALTAQNQASTHLGSNIPSEGSSSLYSFPVKYTQSILPPGAPSSLPGTEIFYSGSGHSVPILLSINEVSSGSVNNQPSFNESPTIDFTITSSRTALEIPESGSTFISTNRFAIESKPSRPGTYNLSLDPINTKQNIGLSNFYLVGKTSLYNFDPFILPLEGINIFENSIYYATPNNYNENRPNQYRYVVENQFGINTTSNLQPIISGSAQKAQVPNSNYTSKKITIPRYLGSKLTSADYNTYASSGSNVEYANGETGSWDGDSSYGKTAAIDKYPRYIAHFEQSINNFTKAGTYTFNVDKLIEVPQRDITEDSLTVNPKTIKIDGSNKNLLATTNTFEKGRKATIAYGTKQILSPVLQVKTDKDGQNPVAFSSSVVVDYSSLKIGNSEIFQGGLEYQAVYSTQRTLSNYTISSSFTTANNVTIIFPQGSGGASGFPISTEPQGDELIGYLTSSFALSGGNVYGEPYWASTGSGFIQLEGPAVNISMSLGLQVSGSSTPRTVSKTYYGSLLSSLHTWNYWVKNQIINGYPLYPGSGPLPPLLPSIFERPGLPYDVSFSQRVLISPGNSENYFKFNTSSSEAGATLNAYEDFDLNFLAERGDEIRVTYNVSSEKSVQTLITQDFQVLDVINHSESYTRQMQFFASTSPSPISGSNMFDRIAVTPDPSTLDIPIPDGEIYQFTIRKRVDADDRVIVYQTPPFKSYGAQTKTGDGYLIPEDLSEPQKKNVQTIINQLQSQNAVPPSSQDTGGGGSPASS